MRKQFIAAILAFALTGFSAAAMAQAAAPSPDTQEAIKITKGPKVENATGNSAVIAWSTNVSGATVVHYGTDPNNLTEKAQMPWGGLTHRVHIKNLKPNTKYYFQVDSGQAAGTGTEAKSPVQDFQTAAVGQSPLIH